MGFRAWLEKQAPDFLLTGQRFWFAIVLALANTLVVIGALNGVSWLQHEQWMRAALGLATGAVVAVAGVYFRESRPTARLAGLLLTYGLPLAVVGAFQVTDTVWLAPWALPAISLLWLSVSPFTRIERGAPRAEQQDRFWWINHQAIATAVIAAAATLVIGLGIAAIERSLSILFGFETGEIFYKIVLPFVGLFLAPLYWLATLPKVSDFRAGELDRADFLPRSIGFIGQFILVPLLVIYALILVAYAAQIAITQKLPQGMIGWMVPGFVVTGAATWLIVHPAFMRSRPLVRLFRGWWFWLTLAPLALFFIAVWVRVDAYGLTAERILLLAGGVWATVLALVFIVGRGDIRLIPALAGLILLLLSVGPWNYSYLAQSTQAMRLDALVMNAGADKSASPPRGDWNAEEIAEARGIIDYLTASREGQRAVREVMGKYGVTWDPLQDGSYVVLEALGISQPVAGGEPRFATLFRDFDGQPTDVTATPYLIRPVGPYGDTAVDLPPLRFTMTGGLLRVGPAGSTDEQLQPLDLTAWLAKQSDGFLVEPWIDFTVAGRTYRLVLQSVSFDRGESNEGPNVLGSLDGQLFSDVEQ
ncbi:DUF4153 domain-containing protein [Devosia sp. A16]|uniref:DUF4153 domain-containing protein n=1 Tax=Devosia sp. A16 TaxID=1736675 RepID=UPI0006D81174|nr:DUF4153 domain-containing protein [Devosia sp. A16]